MENSSQTDLPEPTVVTSEAPLSPQASQKRNWLVIVVIVQFFILLALGSIFAYSMISQLPRESMKDAGKKINVETENDKNIASEISTIFLQDNDLWKLLPDGSTQQITQTGGNVGNYAYSSDYSNITFLQTKTFENSSGYEYTEPVKVIYQDLTTNLSKEIFSLEPTTIPNSEYTLKLRDVTFLPNDMGFVFSTSDTLYQYAIDSQQLRQIFSAPVVNAKSKDVVYGYYDMKYSPDMQKILLKRGFYEWHEWTLLDIKTGVISKLPMNGSGYGTMVEVHWLTHDELIVFEYEDTFPIASTKYYTTDLVGNIRQAERSLSGFYPNNAVYTKDSKYVYGISGKHEVVQTFSDGTVKTDFYAQIGRIDLKTGEVTIIYSKKVEKEFFAGLRLSLDESVIYLVSDLNGAGSNYPIGIGTIYKLDLTTPNAQPEMVIPKGAFKLQN